MSQDFVKLTELWSLKTFSASSSVLFIEKDRIGVSECDLLKFFSFGATRHEPTIFCASMILKYFAHQFLMLRFSYTENHTGKILYLLNFCQNNL